MRQQSKVTDEQIDKALEETFPASDPPFYVGAGAPPSKGKQRKRVGFFGVIIGETPYVSGPHRPRFDS